MVLPIVAIVGRPNVGKSTLFNRLVGRRQALVDDTPGVTRDWREAEGRLGPLAFRLRDTAGLEDAAPESLAGRMRAQTEAAFADADLVLLLIDARAGVTPLDAHFARWLRRSGRKVVLVANKCESGAAEAGLGEAFALGLDAPVPVSAEHGEGMVELYEAMEAALGDVPDQPDAVLSEDRALQLAIVGRPNAGKSTLINRMIGHERLLTGPEPGITRDAISVDWTWRGHRIRLHDTAGLRRRAKVMAKLERLAAADAVNAIKFAEVVVLLLDATSALERQDLTIAERATEEGRALVVAVNKWDMIDAPQKRLAHIRDRLAVTLPQVKGVAVVATSALTGKGVDKLMPAVVGAYERWNRRVPTAALNRWLGGVIEHHPPPLVQGRRLKLRYMTQAKSRPPSFALFVSKPLELPDAYRRYLENGLRETFDLDGVPLRLFLRKGENPFDSRDR
jgi:GTP-binding protein